jgi:hypothetical protein
VNRRQLFASIFAPVQAVRDATRPSLRIHTRDGWRYARVLRDLGIHAAIVESYRPLYGHEYSLTHKGTGWSIQTGDDVRSLARLWDEMAHLDWQFSVGAEMPAKTRRDGGATIQRWREERDRA